MNKSTRCKNCGDIYMVHIRFINDWDGAYAEDLNQCVSFSPMTNLEYLEQEYLKSLDETPTLKSLR